MTPQHQTADLLVDRARFLQTEILAARDDIDRERRLPQPLTESLREAGLMHLWAPATIGGPRLHPIDFLRAIEQLARADGSVGWCAANAGVMSLLAGGLTETAARTIFGDHGIACGSIAPNGKANPVPGGYRVSGRWTYASGIGHSDWVAANSVVLDGGVPRTNTDGAPDFRFMFLPVSEVDIIDVWHVSGMRGTSSQDFQADDVFVPEDHTTPAFAPLALHDGTLYRVPRISLFSFALAGVTVGVAQAAIDALAALAVDKVPVGTSAPLRDRPAAQAAIGRATAVLRAARAGLCEAIGELWLETASGQSPTLDARCLVRMATTHAADASAQAVNLVHAAAGGSALLESGRIARCFRDVHAATQHFGLHANNYEMCGRVLLGIDLGGQRF